MFRHSKLRTAFAANDNTLARTRTVPIPNTITSVPGYPSKLSLYKITASRFWQVRCWIRGKTHKRSTRTTSLRKAQSVAIQFYETLLVLQHPHLQALAAQPKLTSSHDPQPSLTFGALSAQMFANEQARAERGEFAKNSLAVLRNRLDAHILPRFAKRPIAEIDFAELLAFSQFLSKSLSTITVSQYLVAVRKVFTLAVHIGAIQHVPDFPKVKIINKPRAGFTPSEYWTILRKTRHLIGQEHPDKLHYLNASYKLRKPDTQMPADLMWSIGFMVNAFIRPSDLRTLQHRHVEVIRGNGQCYLRLTLPETKRHAAPIVTLRPAVRIYESLSRHHGAQHLAKPTDYLFLPHIRDRHYALRVLALMFNWVLKETGLKQSVHGGSRSLYSLRHSAITFRLLYGSGIDVVTLARNARTSVEVINKHYASSVTGEQNITMLQSKRSKR